MKEQAEKQAVNYSSKTFPELLSLAMAGDREAAAEILARQEEQKQQIESLKIKASSKRAPKAEKTPIELAKDSAYFRCALLIKEFGQESVNMQTLTAASAYLECGLAQGNLRQAFNRVSQVIKAQKTEETVFPAWIVQAAGEIPTLDENKKLEEEQGKVQSIKDIVQKYMDNEQTPATAATECPENSEPVNTPAVNAPAKKASKK